MLGRETTVATYTGAEAVLGEDGKNLVSITVMDQSKPDGDTRNVRTVCSGFSLGKIQCECYSSVRGCSLLCMFPREREKRQRKAGHPPALQESKTRRREGLCFLRFLCSLSG